VMDESKSSLSQSAFSVIGVANDAAERPPLPQGLPALSLDGMFL
jgi:hypothetical protein